MNLDFLKKINPRPKSMKKMENIKKWTITEGGMSLEWSVDVEKKDYVKNSIILFQDMIELLKKELEK